MSATGKSAVRIDEEKYSRGRRGAPAKGVGRATGARVQIPPSPQTKNTAESLQCFSLCNATCTRRITTFTMRLLNVIVVPALTLAMAFHRVLPLSGKLILRNHALCDDNQYTEGNQRTNRD